MLMVKNMVRIEEGGTLILVRVLGGFRYLNHATILLP